MALPGFLAPYVRFLMARRQAPAPATRYLSGTDTLCISVRNLFGSTMPVTIQARVLLPDYTVYETQERLDVPPSVTVTGIRFIPLPQGFLLNASIGGVWPGVIIAGIPRPLGPTQPGQLWAKLALGHGTSPATYIETGILASGWTTVQGPVAYPQGGIRDPTEFEGTQASLVVANPGAGAQWSSVCPASTLRRVFSLGARFDSSAAVATRTPGVEVVDGAGLVVYRVHAATGIVASQGWLLAAAEGLPTATSTPGSTIMLGLPTSCLLRSGWALRSIVDGMQAGDGWSGITLSLSDRLFFN